jgi:penicillin-binding protein 1A
MKKITYFWRKGLWTLLSIMLMFLFVICVMYIYLESQLPNVETLKTVQLQVPLRIYTQDKKLLAEYGEKRRIPVSYNEVPKPLVQAILSTEDQRFFEHPGVDPMGIARAGLQLLKTGRKAEGGSTITMQVARNFFLSRKKTFLRKFNEILLAIKIDSEFSKEKILELYLNKIYLGNRAYGVAAAAKVYYGKKLNELTLAQMAMIAGLPQAPSSQNPISNPAAAMNRRNHVLERMYEEEHISKEAYLEAINAPNTASYHVRKISVHAPYVAEMIRQSLFSHFGEEAYNKGYHVYTTIDSKLQIAANNALETNLLAYSERHGFKGPIAKIKIDNDSTIDAVKKELSKHPKIGNLVPALITIVNPKEVQAITKEGDDITIRWNGLKWARPRLNKGYVGHQPQNADDILSSGDVVYLIHRKEWALSQLPDVEGAIVSLSPKDGGIKALAGGFNFYRSKYNRVTQATRQPGSSFKPFIYAAALENGFTLASLINDAPVVVEDPSQPNLWRPHNDNNQFYGPTRLRMGLIRSRNLVSIRLLEAVGVAQTIPYLERFGFDKETLPNSLSLALGSLSITPLQLAGGYAVFANGGHKVDPHLIDKITDAKNSVILQTLPRIACLPNCEGIPSNQKAPEVITPQVAYLINSALRDVIQKGTGRGAKVLKRLDIAGKTGTTNNQIDAWFSGFNGEYVTTVWVGFDKPKSLHEYASRVALPLWVDYMREALRDEKENRLPIPKGLTSVRIDPTTGLRTTDLKKGVFELFRNKNIPDFQDENVSNQAQAKPIENLF